jgi:hypothetical protein
MRREVSIRGEGIARVMFVLSQVSVWMCTGTAFALPQDGSTPPIIKQEAIYVSLPVFFTALVFTAVSTWTVARYDFNRQRKLERVERKLNAALKKLGVEDIEPEEPGSE